MPLSLGITVNAHKRYNSIEELTVNGKVVESPEVIKKAIVDFYRELYIETETGRPLGSCRGGHIISAEDSLMFQKEFEDQVIWETVKLCAGVKAPRPDGYTMAFYTYYWEVIRGEVSNAIKKFHERCAFEICFNSTYLALIPKKVGGKEFTDFRPHGKRVHGL